MISSCTGGVVTPRHPRVSTKVKARPRSGQRGLGMAVFYQRAAHLPRTLAVFFNIINKLSVRGRVDTGLQHSAVQPQNAAMHQLSTLSSRTLQCAR
jgi:hypothetical protein